MSAMSDEITHHMTSETLEQIRTAYELQGATDEQIAEAVEAAREGEKR